MSDDWVRDRAIRLLTREQMNYNPTLLGAIRAFGQEAIERERERCAAIADAEAAEAYRNPRAANYRNPEMEKMARYTAERIAAVIRRESPR